MSPVGPGLSPFSGRPPGFRGTILFVRNRHELAALAEKHGVATKKQLKAWPKSGQLVVIEVDRPLDELADDLRARGLIT